MAAWAILLSRLSRQNDLIIGTLTANRGRQEIENLIGFFVNTLALRVILSEEMTVEELLMQVKEKVLKAQEYQDVPFEKIVETLAPSRSAAYSPLFQVMFTWQSNETVEPKFPGVKTVIFEEIDYPYEKFDLSLSMKETGSTITGILSYAQSLFCRRTIDSYKRYFIDILEKMTVYDRNNIKGLLIIPDEGSQLIELRSKVGANLVCKTGYDAPVGDIEKKLESIIAGVLKKERVGRYDNFFCLGGHSLLAVKAVYMVCRDFGVEVSLSRFIAEPYISKLAEYILSQKIKPCT